MEPSPQRRCPHCGTPVAQKADTCLMCGAHLQERRKRGDFRLPQGDLLAASCCSWRPSSCCGSGSPGRPPNLRPWPLCRPPAARPRRHAQPHTAHRHLRRSRPPPRPSTRPRRRRRPPCRPTRPATPSSRARPSAPLPKSMARRPRPSCRPTASTPTRIISVGDELIIPLPIADTPTPTLTPTPSPTPFVYTDQERATR